MKSPTWETATTARGRRDELGRRTGHTMPLRSQAPPSMTRTVTIGDDGDVGTRRRGSGHEAAACAGRGDGGRTVRSDGAASRAACVGGPGAHATETAHDRPWSRAHRSRWARCRLAGIVGNGHDGGRGGGQGGACGAGHSASGPGQRGDRQGLTVARRARSARGGCHREADAGPAPAGLARQPRRGGRQARAWAGPGTGRTQPRSGAAARRPDGRRGPGRDRLHPRRPGRSLALRRRRTAPVRGLVVSTVEDPDTNKTVVNVTVPTDAAAIVATWGNAGGPRSPSCPAGQD